MAKKSSNRIKILDLVALVLFIASFSPLVLPQNETEPSLFSIPYTMWMGFLISILFVVLAYLVSLVHKLQKNAD